MFLKLDALLSFFKLTQDEVGASFSTLADHFIRGVSANNKKRKFHHRVNDNEIAVCVILFL